MRNRLSAIILAGILLPTVSFGQSLTTSYRIVSSAVPFLTISPDSRGAAMGDAGVASTPDAASIHWNTAKLARVESNGGAFISVSPWLKDIVGDMNLYSAGGFKKLKNGMVGTVGISYFDQGLIEFTTNEGASAGSFDSKEFAIAAGLAMQLGPDISGGLNLKFVNSNLLGNQAANGQASTPARTVAGDLSIYYNKKRPGEMKKTDFAAGLNLSNIGGKVNYGRSYEYFLPMNFKIGTRFSVLPDVNNKFNFLLDFNKLMVPTPLADNTLPTYGTFTAIYKSFGDAPGGFSEEIREVTTSLGAEYIYQDLIAVRTGYFFEPVSKGNRKYITMGAGLTLAKRYGLDLAYLIPTNAGNPLANTWRISLNLKADALKK